MRCFPDFQPPSRLMRDGPPELTFWNTLQSSTDGKFHRLQILCHTMGLHAQPSILGPGFRQPTPRTWFRLSRVSIPFEGKRIA